jgi:hypothetical protein
MEFGDAGDSGDGVDVVRADAASSQDDDAAGRLADEAREGETAGEGVRLVAGREQALAPERNDVLKCAFHIGTFIEGPMECHFERTGGDYQTAHRLHIDATIFPQSPDNDPVHTMNTSIRIPYHQSFTHFNPDNGLLYLGLAVNEITATRPDQDIDGNGGQS